jgi:hypothetical protein
LSHLKHWGCDVYLSSLKGLANLVPPVIAGSFPNQDLALLSKGKAAQKIKIKIKIKIKKGAIEKCLRPSPQPYY